MNTDIWLDKIERESHQTWVLQHLLHKISLPWAVEMRNMNRLSCKKQNLSLLPATTWLVTRHVLFMSCNKMLKHRYSYPVPDIQIEEWRWNWHGVGWGGGGEGRGEAIEQKGRRRRRRFPSYRASLPFFFPHFPRVWSNSLPTSWMPPLCFESVEQAMLFKSSCTFLLSILPCVYNLGYHYTEEVLFCHCYLACSFNHRKK